MSTWFRPGSAFSRSLPPQPLQWASFRFPLTLVLAMILIFALDALGQLALYEFSIYPRRLSGLIGIVTAPLLHGDLSHLFNNSLPILVLGGALFYFYPRKAYPVIWISWLASGIFTWLWGRENYHLGASGLIYAWAAFIFVSGLIRGRSQLLAFSLLVVFLYGGMAWGLLPVEERVSYEGHWAGALSGLALALYFRKAPLYGEILAKAEPEPEINDDLSREIALFGEDYWQQNDDRENKISIRYHYQSRTDADTPTEQP